MYLYAVDVGVFTFLYGRLFSAICLFCFILNFTLQCLYIEHLLPNIINKCGMVGVDVTYLFFRVSIFL